MQRRRTTLFGSVLAGALSLGLLTGCGTTSDYPVALATQLQTSVQLVTQLSSDGEYEAALTALQNLRKDLAAAQKDGTVGPDRVAEIEAAIAAVAKDLKAKIGDEMVPDKKHTSSPEQTSQAPAPVPQVPVNPVPAPEAPAPAPAPAPVPAPVPSTGSGTPTTPTPTPVDPTPSLPPSQSQSPPPEETVPAPPEPPPSSTAPVPEPSGSGGLPGLGPQPPSEQPDAGGSSRSSGTATP